MLYRFLLKLYFKTRKHPNIQNKTDKYNLIIFSGYEQLDMLNVCLKSILSNFSQVPHIYVVTDHSLNSKNCKKVIHWYPVNEISVISGLDCLAYHNETGSHLLKEFAVQNPLGLKLAAILQITDLGQPVIYSDTDVIWYQDPLPTLTDFLNNSHFNLALSQDVQPAYDSNLINTCGLKELNNKPFLCSGIMFINRLNDNHYRTVEALLPATISQSNHFTEQTIFAYLNKQNGNFCLDKEKYIMELDDMLRFLPKKNPQVIARHYIGGVRHLFWRDALWLN